MAYEQLKNKLIIGDVDIVDLIDQITSASILAIYPVGSIYISGDQTFDPNVSFGGTWEKIENRFLLGSGTRSVGAIGGEENVTLTVSQIPSHNHGAGTLNSWAQWSTTGYSRDSMFTSGAVSHEYTARKSSDGQNSVAGILTLNTKNSQSGVSSSTGGNTSHNNMPPHQVVNIWKRTA